MSQALEFVQVPTAVPGNDLASAVLEGLCRPDKWLPARFFYDIEGSALFEEITRLPEYYLTRAEESILEAHAADIIRQAGTGIALAEFGSGSSCKTRVLIEAALRRQGSLHYTPIDISSGFLAQTARRLMKEYSGLSITALAAEYFDAVAALPERPEPRLILFLGSNIGNFEHSEAQEFLSRIRRRMRAEDRLLLGVDLVKDPAIIEPAYNDSRGVTAAFNKNILARINRELGGHFDLASFRHQAPYLVDDARVEMRLISTVRQSVKVAAIEEIVDFEAGEIIHTENSHKYTLDSFASLCEPAGLSIREVWFDERKWFAEIMLEPRS
jgi:L-histidine Nalpha-methyltransferase